MNAPPTSLQRRFLPSWKRLAEQARQAAVAPSQPCRDLAREALNAKAAWAMPCEGATADGFMFVAFVVACQAMGKADNMRQREAWAPVLAPASAWVSAYVEAIEAAHADPITLPFRRDIDG